MKKKNSIFFHKQAKLKLRQLSSDGETENVTPANNRNNGNKKSEDVRKGERGDDAIVPKSKSGRNAGGN